MFTQYSQKKKEKEIYEKDFKFDGKKRCARVEYDKRGGGWDEWLFKFCHCYKYMSRICSWKSVYNRKVSMGFINYF